MTSTTSYEKSSNAENVDPYGKMMEKSADEELEGFLGYVTFAIQLDTRNILTHQMRE